MSDFLDKAKDTIGGLADKVEGAIPDSVKETASKAKDKTGELVDKAGEAIPDSVKETASKAKDKTGELAGKAGGAIKDVVGKVTKDKDDGGAGTAPPAPAPSSARQPQPSRRMSSPSASRARPFQRNMPGVVDSLAMKPASACRRRRRSPSRRVVRIGGDVGHVHDRPDRRFGGLDGGDHLGLRVRFAHHSAMRRFQLVAVVHRAHAKVVNRGSPPTPSRSAPRRDLSALADSPTHLPSLHR